MCDVLVVSWVGVETWFLGFCCSPGVIGMAVVSAVLNTISFITMRNSRAPKPNSRVLSGVVDLDETGAIQENTTTNMEYRDQTSSRF